MDNSPLGGLPPELRNKVYEYTFAGSTVYLNEFNKGVGALVQTCREIRREARLLLFAEAKIKLRDSPPTKQYLPPNCEYFIIHRGFRKLDKESKGVQILDTFGAEALQVITLGRIRVVGEGWCKDMEDIPSLRLQCSDCFPGLQSEDQAVIGTKKALKKDRERNWRHCVGGVCLNYWWLRL